MELETQTRSGSTTIQAEATMMLKGSIMEQLVPRHQRRQKAAQMRPTTAIEAPGDICIEIACVFTDSNGDVVEGPPPGGTEVEFETTNGTIIGESSFNTTTRFTTSPVVECILVEADDTSDSGTLTVTVTPSGSLNERSYIERYTITD